MKTKSLSINSIFYLIYNVLNTLFPFVTGIYVTHVLIPESIGQVEYARNIAQYFVILSFLGIPTYGLREIAKNRKDEKELNKIYSELMVINGISTICFTLLYTILVLAIPSYRNNASLYLITGISIILNLLNNSWLYEGLEEFKFISIRNLIFKILSFAALVILVRQQSDYLKYAFVTIIGTAGNYIVNIKNAHRFVKFNLCNINIKRHMKSIIYLVAVNLAIEIYYLVDVTMLGIFTTDKNVAFYSYGSKIYKIILQVLNTFTIVLVPRISLCYKEKKYEDLKRIVTKALEIILLLSIPMIVGLFFVSSDIVTWIYGNEYIVSANVLKILSVNIIIAPIGYLLGSRMLLITGNEKKMIIPVSIGAIINVILNYFFINLYDEYGAAIASVVSEFSVMIIYLCLSRKYIIINIEILKNSLLKCLLSTVVMSMVIFIISKITLESHLVSIIQIIMGFILYAFCLLIMKEPIALRIFNIVWSKKNKKCR